MTEMKGLIAAGLVIISLVVSIMIGGGMLSKTENVTRELFPVGSEQDAFLEGLGDDSSDILTTFTSLLPLLVLAIIGGLALGYIMIFGRSAG